MTDPYRLSTQFVSSKDLKVLRSLLSLSSATAAQWQVSEAEDDQADALLVDVDHPDGAAAWPELAHGAVVAIALSRRRQFAARLLLQKPIRSQQLLRLLEQAVEVRDDPETEEGWPVLVFGVEEDSELPLAEHLRRHSWDQPVLVGGDYLPELVIDPGAGVWYSSASDRELAHLLRRKIRRADARRISSAEMVEHINGLEQQNLANLKWRAGLALSSGALHPDLAGEVRFMLPQVPLQALSDTAYSRQARILIREPVTAEDLLQRSLAERSDVAEFLNACHSCGFLLVDRGQGRSAHG